MATAKTGLAVVLPSPLRCHVANRARGLMLRAAVLNLRAGRPALARRLLTRIGPALPNSRRVRGLIEAAFAGEHATGRVAEIRLADLNFRLRRPVECRDHARVLRLAAEFEAMERPMPADAGTLIARQLVSEPGRARILAAVRRARETAPDSPYLISLQAMLMAKEGAYQEASALVRAALEALARQNFASEAEQARAQRRFDRLRHAWRVVDLIAREDTSWSDPEGSAGYADLALVDLATDTATSRGRVGVARNFKEPLLQARDEDGYLAACLAEFRAAEAGPGGLPDRLRAIADMLRQGARRQFTYHKAWAQAGACHDEIAPEIAALTRATPASRLDPKAAEHAVQTLAQAMGILRSLKREAALEALREDLFGFAMAGLNVEAAWLALPELVIEERSGTWAARSRALRARLPEVPAKAHHLRAYLKWALWSREFLEADRVFARLPAGLRTSPAALYHVNILQRQSRFGAAVQILRGVHGAMLARPGGFNPWQHWNLMRRDGEMAFLNQTARAFARTPQPRRPEGVIVIAARNIDQLRKYPLVVLMELRRRNWAVVSLVEGLLPQDRTGIDAIDVLSGCITIERGLTAEAEAAFPALDGFVAVPSEGRLEWRGLNLRHSMMEDARIAKRAYDVDFTCPALTEILGKLMDSTALMARATLHAHRTLPAAGLRCGMMALFNSRLPDTLFRLYCAEEGDPDGFFALQVANGYENYFANFGNAISTRCVVRNVTRYPEVRSATFPRPEAFARYVEAHRDRAPEVLARVEHIATAKRSPGPDGPEDPARAATLERIAAWRAAGKPVVCLFGRVVCDSAVPWDGGPAHADFKDWLNHTIAAVRGSDTLLLIKPHPHELSEQIATYLNQHFFDLIEGELPGNAILLGHRWFDIETTAGLIDAGLVYNGTVVVELALKGVPCIQCNHFGPIDYPLGHVVPKDRADYARLVRFEIRPEGAPDMAARAALWLDYMSNGRFALDYRYHARPVTNRVVYPPWWVPGDIDTYLEHGDPAVSQLAGRILGTETEPDH